MGHRQDSSTPAVKYIYDGIEIGYYIETNDWSFVLRGRTRTTPSLQQAKDAIDKPVETKKPKFEPTKAFMFSSWTGDKVAEVTVTSIIENGKYVWVQANDDPAHRYRSNGRSKERADSVFPITPKNTAALTRWENLE